MMQPWFEPYGRWFDWVIADEEVWLFQQGNWSRFSYQTSEGCAEVLKHLRGRTLGWLDFSQLQLSAEPLPGDFQGRLPREFGGMNYWSVDLNAAQKRLFEVLHAEALPRFFLPLAWALSLLKTRQWQDANRGVWQMISKEESQELCCQRGANVPSPEPFELSVWRLSEIWMRVQMERLRSGAMHRKAHDKTWVLMALNGLAMVILVVIWTSEPGSKLGSEVGGQGVPLGLAMSQQTQLKSALEARWLMEDLLILHQWLMASEYLRLKAIEWQPEWMGLNLEWLPKSQVSWVNWEGEAKNLMQAAASYGVHLDWQSRPLRKKATQAEVVHAQWRMD